MGKKFKKWPEELNKHLSEEDIQITNRYTAKGLTSVIIKEIQIQSTMR